MPPWQTLRVIHEQVFRVKPKCAELFRCVIPALFWSTAALAQSGEAGVALPQDEAPIILEDRLRLEVGAFGAGLDTSLRVDPSPLLQGTRVGVEDDLALPDFRVLPQLELSLLPGERHVIRLGSLSVRRSARTRLDRTIVFDDETYLVNERVDSTLNFSMFGLTYGYQFLRNQAVTLAATFGIQIAEIEANAVVTNRVLREAESGVAPLPLLGIEGRYLMSPRLGFEGRLQYLSVDIDEVSGSILDARVAALWRFNPHLAAGVGYRHIAINVDSRDATTPGLLDLGLGGPMLFLQASL